MNKIEEFNNDVRKCRTFATTFYTSTGIKHDMKPSEYANFVGEFAYFLRNRDKLASLTMSEDEWQYWCAVWYEVAVGLHADVNSMMEI